jgi:thiosulfate/3-mercaptopyruvate sulfurtransferase
MLANQRKKIMSALKSTQWLAEQLDDPALRLVDATYVLASDGRNCATEFEAAHIPGAVFLDLGKVADSASPLPMMLPDADQFSAQMAALGLGTDDQIILYDNSPYRSAARAWWMLTRIFGFSQVSILDGGFGKWLAEGRATESGPAVASPTQVASTKDASHVRTKADMLQNLDSKAEQMLDARGKPRFTGEEEDPRPGIAAGHIPGSFNLPYGQMFNADGTWKSGDALKAAFADAGIDLNRPIITSCGSGLTAATLVFGAHLIGKRDVALYDGSWSEWGGDAVTPKTTHTA